MGEPVRVGDLVVALPGVAERLAEARLLAAWPELAGPGGARSRAESVEDGVLQVAVASSGWLHRLTLDEPALLARCRDVAPAVSLRAIRFRLAPLAESPLEAAGADSPAADPDQRPEPQDTTTIDAALAPVRDLPDLANAIKRAMRATGTGRGGGEVPR
jgi:Dna[CI] antecedent, DciA